MKTKWTQLGMVAALLVGWSLAALGQAAPTPVRLLLIDETKTFTSTIKIAAAVGALRQTGLFDVSIRLSDVEDDYVDPLFGEVPEPGEAPYDLILIFPRGLDTKANVSIWLVSDGLETLAPEVRSGVDLISTIIDPIFAGSGQAVDGSEDLWPALLWPGYVLHGWMQ